MPVICLQHELQMESLTPKLWKMYMEHRQRRLLRAPQTLAYSLPRAHVSFLAKSWIEPNKSNKLWCCIVPGRDMHSLQSTPSMICRALVLP